jgi:hypothetical protein
MACSRRSFLRWAGAVSGLAVTSRRRGGYLTLEAAESGTGFRKELLPSEKEVWDQLIWMAKLGPKYTGNEAHTKFVEFLATEMKGLGLEVSREHYTFPRWDAKRTALNVASKGGATSTVPVTSYFPYSGSTPAAGVTGAIVYAGSAPKFDLDGLAGKIALIDFKTNVRQWDHTYQTWGTNPPGEQFYTSYKPARSGVNDLTQFAMAGAVGVIIGWTDVSDANAAYQYSPFSRPPQGVPGLYVGRESLARLKALAGTGAQATLVLEAETYPNTPTDTVIAQLPGTTSDELVIVNTHTDGPNATEENGALGLLAIAKYFSKLPRSERRRTMVFPMTSGHFAGPWVPSMRGVMQKYPEMIKKTVAAVTVEHLGCREWLDDASFNYKATGKNEWSIAITPSKVMGGLIVDALKGSSDRAAVVNPVNGGWLGEGGGLSRAGIPTIGYIPQPNYLCAGPDNCEIDKLSGELMHAQIEVFVKVLHGVNRLSAAELKA